MTQAVTVYRWDDPGAPQLTGIKPSEFLTVFKKCLVEGYGEKPAAGWSIVEESAPTDSPRLVVKNDESNGGSGGFSIFYCSNDNDDQKVYLRSGQNAIDSDTYENANGYFAFNGDYGTGTRLPTNWILLATATAFHFFSFSTDLASRNDLGTVYMPYLFTGDFISNYPNDPATYISMCGKQNNSTTTWTNTIAYQLSQGARDIFKVYPLDGGQTPADASLTSIFGSRFHSRTDRNSEVNITMLSPIYICLGAGDFYNSYTQSDSQPFIRGRIPGFFVADKAGFLSSEMPVIRRLNNQEHYLLPSSNSDTNAVWINMEEW